MRNTDSKEQYSLPLNSTVEFGVLYDPHQNVEDAMKGYHFETVGELMAMNNLPKVIRATRSYEGSSPETSVKENEVLMVKGVKTSVFFGRGKRLIVHSLTSAGERFLHEKCAGGFSTKPKNIRLRLPTLLQNDIALPETVVILADREVDKCLPLCMVNAPVTLEGYKGETSIIATSAEYDPSTEPTPVFEIHSGLEIEIEAVVLPENEQKLLSQSTLALHKSLDVSQLSVYMEKPSNKAYELQTLLYRKVSKEKPADAGIQLVWPLLLDDDSDSTESDSGSLLQESLPSPEYTDLDHESEATPLVPNPPPGIDPSADSVYQVVSPSQVNEKESVYTDMVPADTCLQSANSSPLTIEERIESADGIYQVISPSQVNEKESVYTDTVPADTCLQSANSSPLTFEERIETLEHNHSNLQHHVTQLSEQLQQLLDKTETGKPDDVKEVAIQRLMSSNARLQDQISELKSEIQASSEKFNAADSAEENRKFLTSLDCNAVS